MSTNEVMPSFKLANLFNPQGECTYVGQLDGTDLLDWIGPGAGTLGAGTAGRAKAAPHNPTVTFEVTGDEGYRLIKVIPITGTTREKGAALEKGVVDLFLACGLFEGSVEGFKAWATDAYQKDPNLTISAQDIIAWCTGKRVFYDVGTYANDNGQPKSSIDNFYLPRTVENADGTKTIVKPEETYTKNMATPGKGRRPRPEPQARKVTAPVGPVGPMGPIGGPGARPSAPVGAGIVPPMLGTPGLTPPPPPAQARPAGIPGIPGMPTLAAPTTPLGIPPMPGRAS